MIVGRSVVSGEIAVQNIKTVGAGGGIDYVPGDIGTVADANELVKKLAQVAEKQSTPKGFDYLVMTASVFPDWTKSQTQADGVHLPFFVTTVGRYIILKSMDSFMKISDQIRILNVMASGTGPRRGLPKDLVEGKRDAKHTLESMLAFRNGNDLMQLKFNAETNATRVSTHPGLLQTDLHRGQGSKFDWLEKLIIGHFGLPIDECGRRQASILASDRLHAGKLNYVSFDMVGRLPSPSLSTLAKNYMAWFDDLLESLNV